MSYERSFILCDLVIACNGTKGSETLVSTLSKKMASCRGTRKGDIFIVEIETMKLQQILRDVHGQTVTSLEFSPNDKYGMD